jgi:PA14 domain
MQHRLRRAPITKDRAFKRGRRPRLAYYLFWSLAVHVGLVGLVSVKACRSDLPSVLPALSAQTVAVEVATFPAPFQPKTTRAGGGAPALRINHSPIVPRPFARHLPNRKEEAAAPKLVPPPAEKPGESETPVAATVDVVAAPSPVHGAVGQDPEAMARSAVEGASGAGPGARGGPGGPGAGWGGAPLVSGKFAFGSDARGAFKGVACFIRPGVLRIADVHGCTPMAVFYTNTFDVFERQQVRGFPGIADRSSWFMIEYTGAFTVGQNGTYEFRLHSDDGSYLFIDGTMVIENDGKHQPTSRSGSIPLQAGLHQLRLLYAQTTDRMALQLFVRVPGTYFEKLFTPRI